MHEDLDIPGPAELEQLADNEAGEGRMPNCQHFRRLARKWREDREDRDALRHALLQATTDKARARRTALQPDADRTAYAVVLQGDTGITLAPLCKAPACAVQALSPFEGAPVVGLATIAMEREAISGMQYRLKHAGVAPQQPSAPVGVVDIAVELEHFADCPGRVLALAGKLRSLAQKPAADGRICATCDGGPGNDGPCLCGDRRWEQPAAVDEAMVERAAKALWDLQLRRKPWSEADRWQGFIRHQARVALTAALAGQHTPSALGFNIGQRVEWQDNVGRWHPAHIVRFNPATYDAKLDDGCDAEGFAKGRFRALAGQQGGRTDG